MNLSTFSHLLQAEISAYKPGPAIPGNTLLKFILILGCIASEMDGHSPTAAEPFKQNIAPIQVYNSHDKYRSQL